jgi:hypothetical protein
MVTARSEKFHTLVGQILGRESGFAREILADLPAGFKRNTHGFVTPKQLQPALWDAIARLQEAR